MKRLTLSLLVVSWLLVSGGCSRVARRHACYQPQPCNSCSPCPTGEECSSCEQGQTLGFASSDRPTYLASKPTLQYPRSVRSSTRGEAPVRLLPAPTSDEGGYYPTFLAP